MVQLLFTEIYMRKLNFTVAALAVCVLSLADGEPADTGAAAKRRRYTPPKLSPPTPHIEN
jgi:hypothetical protein